MSSTIILSHVLTSALIDLCCKFPNHLNQYSLIFALNRSNLGMDALVSSPISFCIHLSILISTMLFFLGETFILYFLLPFTYSIFLQWSDEIRGDILCLKTYYFLPSWHLHPTNAWIFMNVIPWDPKFYCPRDMQMEQLYLIWAVTSLTSSDGFL